MRKISSFGDPRLYALSVVAEHLSHSAQPLVPERLFVTGGSSDESPASSQGMLGLLLSLLVAEKSGFQSPVTGEAESLKSLAEQLSADAVDSLKSPPKDLSPAKGAVPLNRK
jgi:hypothetical protein